MAFEKICTLDDVWEGEMATYQTADGTGVLLVVLRGGDVRAYQAMCPHQEVELVEGTLEKNILTCRAHLWQFDVCTGQGVNPADSALAQYPTKVEGENIYVDIDGIQPLSHA
jgi:toluene monooxygenase system ferredoxin subunit